MAKMELITGEQTNNQKNWNVNFAFNNVTDTQLKKITKWLDPKKLIN